MSEIENAEQRARYRRAAIGIELALMLDETPMEVTGIPADTDPEVLRAGAEAAMRHFEARFKGIDEVAAHAERLATMTTARHIAETANAPESVQGLIVRATRDAYNAYVEARDQIDWQGAGERRTLSAYAEVARRAATEPD